MRRALVVGLNNYPSAPLRGAVHDAIGMQSVLERHGDGSPNFAVKLMVDPDTKVTKASLREAITTLFRDEVEVALLYFSGHGMIQSSGGVVVTPDYARYDEGITMDEILTLANGSAAHDKVVILDCCHSGAFGSPAVTGGRVAQIGEGVTVLTASRGGESAMEQDGSGVFTALVVDALSGGAADLRGAITPGGLYAYVDEALGPWEQRPVFKTNVSRFTALRNVEAPIPVEVLRRITKYFSSPEDEFALDPSYEFTEPGSVPERVAIFKDLQKFESVRLVRPVGEEHMYFAAINRKSCKLTAFGYQYWRLVTQGRI